MKMAEKIRLLSVKFADNKREYLFCLISTLVWGLIAHAYGFFCSNFSHDSLNAFYADAVENRVKIESGRFFVFIYRSIVRNQVAQPWLIGLLGLLFISIAVFFVVRMFGAGSKRMTVLVSGILVTNVSVISQVATYVHEFDFNMLALVLAVVAAYLWKKQARLWYLGFAVLLFITMGIYQSYISVTIALLMIASILALLDGEDIKKTVIKGLYGIGALFLACALYFVFSKIVYAVGDFSQQSRTDVFEFEGITNIPLFYAKLFVDTYLHFASCIMDFKVYELFIIVPVAAISILIVVFVIFYALHKRNDKDKIVRILLIVLLGLLLPIGMDVTYILARGNGIHDLMTYAIWFTYVLMLLAIRWFATSDKAPAFRYSGVLKVIGGVLVMIFIWQNIVLANSAYMKKDIEAKSTLSLMTRVVAQLEERDDYEMGVTPVAFVGVSDTYVTVEGFEKVKNIIGVGIKTPISQDTSKTTYNVYESYFKYVLNYPINMCPDELHKELKESEEVEAMPSFPSKGCIEMIDGVLVVKMGDYWFSKDE